MSRCGALAGVLGCGALLACATAVDVDRIPLCGPVETLQPLLAGGECDEDAIGSYLGVLSDQVVKPTSQALVRVELDERARVGSVCVEEGVGAHAWYARQHLARNLAPIQELEPGPACAAGRRLDLNYYQAKLVEIEEAKRWCSWEMDYEIEALRSCDRFPSDWILYYRPPSVWPRLYVKPEGAQNADERRASDTLRRCGRRHGGPRKVSACILEDGFVLMQSPQYEILARPSQ